MESEFPKAQKGFDMKKFIKSLLNWFVFFLTGKGEIANEAIEAGLIDYSGQGRDKYGK